jgi:hypothetical protein
VYILKVIGWCDGRMGGWRFVKGLRSMDDYMFRETRYSGIHMITVFIEFMSALRRSR